MQNEDTTGNGSDGGNSGGTEEQLKQPAPTQDPS